MDDLENVDDGRYPAFLAVGIVLVAILTFAVLLLSMSSIGSKQSDTVRPRQAQQSEAPGVVSEPYDFWQFRSEIVVTVGTADDGEPVTVHLRPVLAYNQENSAVRAELERRRMQLKNVIVNALASLPVKTVRDQKYQLLQDLLTSEVNNVLTSGNRIQAVYFGSIYIE